VQIIRGFVLFALTLLLALAPGWPNQRCGRQTPPMLPRAADGAGGNRPVGAIWGFQSTKIDVAVRTFQQKRVVLVDLASQVAGLVVMLVLGLLTHRSGPW
jgi:hypothetical protein